MHNLLEQRRVLLREITERRTRHGVISKDDKNLRNYERRSQVALVYSSEYPSRVLTLTTLS